MPAATVGSASDYEDGTLYAKSAVGYTNEAGGSGYGNGKGKGNGDPDVAKATGIVKGLDLSSDYLSIHRPFFISIQSSSGGLLGALSQLNDQIIAAHRPSILSNKKPFSWVGRTVSPGQAGFYAHGGLPKVLVAPGRYPGLPFSNWFARKWQGVLPLSSTVLQFQGLIAVQCAQNQAAVVCDPSNKVFVIKNGGFVALSLEGSYRVLGVVDQVHLKTAIRDPLAEDRILGYREDVTMDASVGMSGQTQQLVVATFVDIPANNTLILQRGDELEQLPAGQHVLTNPNITIRGWFTKGETQLEVPARDMYTKDQVPVELKVYLRWQLIDPLKLCYHGYNTPYAALKDKALSVLTQIVSHLEYSSMIRQRAFTPGEPIGESMDDPGTAFLDALRTRAMDELHEAALEYGIVLKDLAVIDRKFKGEIAKTMDSLTTRALQAQVEASNVDRENSNRVKKEEGSLSVANVQAKQRKTEADADAYALITRAKAEAQAVQIAAQADAEAIKIAAKADAEAIAMRALADSSVVDGHARTTQSARIEVQRISAYGNRTVFAPTDGVVTSSMAAGFGMATGAKEAQR